MKDNTYVVIQSFMLSDLHLKGNELIVYAVIFGYTQDGEHWYYGTRGHLAEWCGATKGTVTNCLKSLVEKGYIRKREVQHPGYVENQYQAVVENLTTLSKIGSGCTKNCDTTLSKIGRYNNIPNNKEHKGDMRYYPDTIACKCGGAMVKTATCKSGTDIPYYRCPECGEERLYR